MEGWTVTKSIQIGDLVELSYPSESLASEGRLTGVYIEAIERPERHLIFANGKVYNLNCDQMQAWVKKINV